MSIGSAWRPTGAYKRHGEKVGKLALEFVREGDSNRVRVRRAELSLAVAELIARTPALFDAADAAQDPSDRLRLRRELDAYHTYLREHQRSLVAQSAPATADEERQLDELLLVLTLSTADEYLSEALSELAAVGAHDLARDAHKAHSWIGDGPAAHWDECLTSDGLGFHWTGSIDAMRVARDLRRLLVHHGGIVPRDFIVEYPEFPAESQTRLRLPGDFTFDVLLSVGSLIGAVDHCIAHRIVRANRNGPLLRER